MGRTGIYACGESVSRRNSLESVALFSLKQEAPASIGGGTFTNGLDQLYGQFQKHFADDLPAEDAVLARIDADWTQRFLNKYLYN